MNEFVSSIIVFAICYCIGSFPTAYLLVRLKSKKDLTKEGSGNIGTLNSFMVSKSKTIGIAVLLFDLLKGLVPLYVMLMVLRTPYPVAMTGACGLIMGHNYPVWLKFKGGRGLATGAGIFFVVNYFIVIGWLLVWLLVFLMKKKVLVSNTIATFSLPLFVIAAGSFSWMAPSGSAAGFTMTYFTVFSIIITIIILSRHLEVFTLKKA
jgi:glycerol-3-phosphate acyltransferase PlsY